MTDKDKPHLPAKTSAPADDSLSDGDILGLLIFLAEHKKLLFGFPLLAAVVAAAVTLLMPNVYTATSRVLPPQQNQAAAAALLGQLGALSGASANALGIKNPGDLYVGMLKSRSVSDGLIDEFDLQRLYKKDTRDETRKELDAVTNIGVGKDGIIFVEVDDPDPTRAAQLANGYVAHLERLNERLAVTEAAQRRLFFEQQLRQQKVALASAETDLRAVQEKTGLIKLDEQGKAIIDAVAQIRAQIAAKEVQLGAMQSFTTERNPDRIRAEAELSGLRKQLAKLEKNSLGESGTFVPTGKVPELGLEFVRSLRDVKYNEALLELLAKQYELARLDEVKDASIIQVLDRAIPPDRKSKPKRFLIVLFASIGAGFVAVMVALGKGIYQRALLDPSQRPRLDVLVNSIRPSARK